MKIAPTQMASHVLGLGLALFYSSDSSAQETPQPGPTQSIATVGKSEITEKRELDFHIRVTAPVKEVRTSFDFYCTDLYQEFCNTLGMNSSQWKIPIYIAIQGKDSDRVTGRYLAHGITIAPDDSISLAFHVKLHDQFSEEEFAREFIRVVLLEQMLATYRNRTADLEKKRIAVPDWIVHGFSQLIIHKKNGRPSAFFSGYIKSGQLLSVEQIFAQENPEKLNPLSLAAYDASATALVDALRTQKDGKEAFRLFLSDLTLVGQEKTNALLSQHFPGLREVDNGLEKWWALQVATMGKQQALEFMDSEETNRLLEESLIVRISAKTEKPKKTPKEKTLNFLARFKKEDEKETDSKAAQSPPNSGFQGPLDQYTVYRKLKKWKEALMTNHRKLQQLKARGFPLYRPLIVRYELLINRIRKNQTKGIDQELEDLSKMREQIRQTMELTKDYLNLYEAASAPEKSAVFDSYIRMRQTLEHAEPPKRNDRISKHLDDLEKEFSPLSEP